MDSYGCIPGRPAKHRRFRPQEVGGQTQRPSRTDSPGPLFGGVRGCDLCDSAVPTHRLVPLPLVPQCKHERCRLSSRVLGRGEAGDSTGRTHTLQAGRTSPPELRFRTRPSRRSSSFRWRLMPHEPADVVYTAVNLAAVILTLLLLGVRDWRIFGLAFCPLRSLPRGRAPT